MHPFHLAPNLRIADRPPATVDSPGVCRHSDAPTEHREDRPEKAASDSLDTHQYQVDCDVDANVNAETALLPDARDDLSP